jgi:toxin-antitoxin system PIN domain toxin
MILPDANVLIYAFRRDSPHHDTCKPWLDAVVAGDALFGVSPLALTAVARISTNPRAFRQPSTLTEAFGFCEDLLNQAHCVVVHPSERHWAIFQRLCLDTNTSGPRVTDAWFAALAIEHGCTWITYDRDYARFPGLDWRLPSGRDAPNARPGSRR